MPIPFDLTPNQVAAGDSSAPVKCRLVSAADSGFGVSWVIGPERSDAGIFASDAAAALTGDSELSVVVINSRDRFAVDLPAWMLPFLPDDGFVAAVGYRQRESLPGFHEQPESLRNWLTQVVGSDGTMRSFPLESESESVFVSESEESCLPALRPSEPGTADAWLCERIETLRMDRLLPRIRSESDAVALQAGLLQVNDFLDASHEHSQSVQGKGRHAAGDYWHAVVHRREPDYSNAKYWFRRVGESPIFRELASRASALLDDSPEIEMTWGDRLCSGGWDAFAFVDLCQSCPVAENDELSRFARRLQWIEMQLLLRQTWEDACGTE